MSKVALAKPMILAAAALSLVGCNPAYRMSDVPGSAQVRFVSAHETDWASSVAFYAHRDDSCDGARKMKQMGGLIAFGGRNFDDAEQGMPKDPAIRYRERRYFETRIPANAPFMFTVASGENNRVCFVTGTFLPAPDAQYEVAYDTEARYCVVTVDRIDFSSGTFVRTHEPSTKQRPVACSFFWN